MTTSDMPERGADPEDDKRRAVKLAGQKVRRWRKAEAEAAQALWFAHYKTGATLRELEGETGIPFKTVDRIIKRRPGDETEDDDG